MKEKSIATRREYSARLTRASSPRRGVMESYRLSIAVAPIATCLLVPLIKVGGVAYIYDIVMVVALIFLGFPKARLPRGFVVSWWLLLSAIAVAWLSGVVRAGGPSFQQFGQTLQYGLGLLYARSIASNILSERLSIERLATGIALAATIMGSIGVAQYLLLQFDPWLAVNWYSKYVSLGGYDPEFMQERLLRVHLNTGGSRVTGTWDVSTTYGGMLSLGAAWIILSEQKPAVRFFLFLPIALAALMTSTRHAWFLCIMIALILFWKRSFRATAIAGIVLLSLFALALRQNVTLSSDTLAQQVRSRYLRTMDEGFGDSSLQARYVDGTLRFIKYAALDPTILLFGLGIRTDRLLTQSALTGGENFSQLGADYQYGFVSNGWLLIWRSWGILGFLGLLSSHSRLLRLGGIVTLPLVAISAIIFGSDNYSIEVPRCFFLLMVFLGVVWCRTVLTVRSRRFRDP